MPPAATSSGEGRAPTGVRLRRHALSLSALLTVLLPFLGMCLAPECLSAQAGTLLVRVSGPEGDLADATVSVLFLEQVMAQAGTDADGLARFAGLPAGSFRVQVVAMGHETRIVEGVRVETGESRLLDVELVLAPIPMEGLTVRAERVQIQRENTEFTTRVDEAAIRLLPTTHRATDLVALTPGARPGYVWGGANFQANSYRIDGLSANHPGLGGDLLQPSVHWIDRVEVRGLGAGAEYGGFQGGLIDVVTKGGSNTFQGFLQSSVEHDLISGSNLVKTEVGREVTGRMDVEGEIRGPLLRDRLFFYVSGKRVAQNSQALNHLRQVEGRYAPVQEEQSETKLFGKLTWSPRPRHQLVISGAFTETGAHNYGITGYETAGATHRYSAPTWFVNGSLTEILGVWGVLEARVNHFSRDERHDSYGGLEVPGIRTFALSPPYTSFGNAPFTLRSAPSSTSATLQGSFRLRTGSLEHQVKMGGEYTLGSFLDRRIRNGGMTWFPANVRRFDPADPSTWTHLSSTWVASQWGGEVRLDADVATWAAYVQTALSLGPRIVLSPGVRWNRWSGFLTPASGDRFPAVEAEGWDPRVGLSVGLTRDGTLVATAHWGRYHQNMISQMFDRVAGGNVFTDEEFWYYTGGDLVNPSTTFTEAQRNAMAGENRFRKFGQVILNETGEVLDYRQPYVDQWLVGLEKQVGSWMKMQALYTRRGNRDMVALVDLNRATNYTLFTGVRVFDAGGLPVPFSGGSVFLQELYVPNHTILERLRCKANQDCPDALPVPGLTAADTLRLTWDPHYVLTTAPGARREFDQVQLTMEIALPEWGASLSFVKTGLKGNLDNVSGYDDPETYGAGPYVRVNEGVNAYGTLENFADQEWKVAVWGQLPWDLRGGAFWTFQSGDHYSPRWRLYGLGFFHYKVGTGALQKGGSAQFPGQEVDYQLLWPLEGHHLFVGPRGRPVLERRNVLDLRLERLFRPRGRVLAVSLDAFNVLRNEAVTKLNTMVNNGPDYGFRTSYSLFAPGIAPNQYYEAPQERSPPRYLRLGLALHF
jgi:hypothetical protein